MSAGGGGYPSLQSRAGSCTPALDSVPSEGARGILPVVEEVPGGAEEAAGARSGAVQKKVRDTGGSWRLLGLESDEDEGAADEDDEDADHEPKDLKDPALRWPLAPRPAEELSEYRRLHAEHGAKGRLHAGETYFLVSHKWHVQWRQWVGHPLSSRGRLRGQSGDSSFLSFESGGACASAPVSPARSPIGSPLIRPGLAPRRTNSDDYDDLSSWGMLRMCSSGPIRARSRALRWSKERPGPIDNRALLEPEDSPSQGSSGSGPSAPRRLRRGLFEHLDFDIVPRPVWELLHGRYGGGPPVGRQAIRLLGGEVQVELYGLRLRACAAADAERLASAAADAEKTLTVEMSRTATVLELEARLREVLDLGEARVRLWHHLGGFSESLDDCEELTLEKCRILEDQLISVELLSGEEGALGTERRLSFDGAEVAEDGPELRSPVRSPARSPALGPAMRTASLDSEELAEDDGAGAEDSVTTAGLRNLGNTCFMASSMQCLSNIPRLRDYFLGGEFRGSLEVGGKKTDRTSGDLASSFAELLTKLWRGRIRSVAPWDFKSVVEKHAEQFCGYRQHDSMEFIEYVIDGLKEDCNFVKGKKIYVERVDSDGRPDSELGREASNKFLLRNDSLVDDLFVGFLKSQTTCPEPDCKRESVVFDPCLSVKVPLMSTKQSGETTFSVTVATLASSGKEVAYLRVSVNKFGTVGDLVEAAAEEAGLKSEQCILLELFSGRVYKFFEAEDRLEDIGSSDILLLYALEDVQAFQMSAEQRWGSGEVLEFGDIVVVTSTFQSNSERSQELAKGCHGKVIKVDEDGDARIKFDGYDMPQWVFRRNFENLKTDRNLDSVETRFDPSSGQVYTLRELVQAFESEYSFEDVKAYWRDSMKPLNGEPPMRQCGAIVHFRQMEYGFRGAQRELVGIPLVFCTRRDQPVSALVEAVREELKQRFGDCAKSGWKLYRAEKAWDVEKTETLLDAPEAAEEAPEEGAGDPEDPESPSGAERKKEKEEAPWLREREYLVVEWEGEVPAKVAGVKAEAERDGDGDEEEGGVVTLEKCFEWLTEAEQLSEYDSVYCSRCKEHRQAFKKVDFWTLPPVLVLQLKRFEFTGVSRSRLSTPVRFPLEGLDLRRFCLSKSSSSFPDGECLRAGCKVVIKGLESKDGRLLNGLKGTAMYFDSESGRFCVRLREDDAAQEWKKLKSENLDPLPADGDGREPPEAIYDLVGISKHMGTISFGHYVAYARSSRDGLWRLFDDDDVHTVEPSQVESEQVGAYVLFYLRRDMRPEAWGDPPPLRGR